MKAGATVLAISTDEAGTSARFKAELKAPYPFIADDQGALATAYGVRMFLFGLANRVTFVVGQGRKVLAVQEGGEAMDPSKAVAACSLEAPAALKVVLPDAGPR